MTILITPLTLIYALIFLSQFQVSMHFGLHQTIRISMYHYCEMRFCKKKSSCMNKIFSHFCRYAQMCQAIVREESVSPEDFSKYFLPNLLSLGSDPVPNVRITVAKTLSYYYQTEGKIRLHSIVVKIHLQLNGPGRLLQSGVSLDCKSRGHWFEPWSGHILSWRLIIDYFLQSFFPFR